MHKLLWMPFLNISKCDQEAICNLIEGIDFSVYQGGNMTVLFTFFKKAHGQVMQMLGRASSSQQQRANLMWEGSCQEDASCCTVVWVLKD